MDFHMTSTSGQTGSTSLQLQTRNSPRAVLLQEPKLMPLAVLLIHAAKDWAYSFWGILLHLWWMRPFPALVTAWVQSQIHNATMP